MTTVLVTDHVHAWGTGAFCVACPARKCKHWSCRAPRVAARSVCARHTNGLTQIAPAEAQPAPAVRVTVYSMPGGPSARLSIEEGNPMNDWIAEITSTPMPNRRPS
jgi:hypothetical protein